MSTFMVRIPDEADGRLAFAVLEAVEPGSSGHTLIVGPEDVRHSRLGVLIRRLRVKEE